MEKVLTEQEVNDVGNKFPQGSSSYVSNRCCTGARADVLNCNVTSPSPCADNQLVTGVSKKTQPTQKVWLTCNSLPANSVSYSFYYSNIYFSGTIARLGWYQNIDEYSGWYGHPTSCEIPTDAIGKLTDFTINSVNRGTVYAFIDTDGYRYVNITNYI